MSKFTVSHGLFLHFQPFTFIVADGFGNQQEVISIYRKDAANKQPKLIHRISGYQNSMGLMYQYATSYCGMKENQDEYKFLGYESMIMSVLNDAQLKELENFADETVEVLLKLSAGANVYIPSTKGELINFKLLTTTKST